MILIWIFILIYKSNIIFIQGVLLFNATANWCTMPMLKMAVLLQRLNPNLFSIVWDSCFLHKSRLTFWVIGEGGCNFLPLVVVKLLFPSFSDWNNYWLTLLNNCWVAITESPFIALETLVTRVASLPAPSPISVAALKDWVLLKMSRYILRGHPLLFKFSIFRAHRSTSN